MLENINMVLSGKTSEKSERPLTEALTSILRASLSLGLDRAVELVRPVVRPALPGLQLRAGGAGQGSPLRSGGHQG